MPPSKIRSFTSIFVSRFVFLLSINRLFQHPSKTHAFHVEDLRSTMNDCPQKRLGTALDSVSITMKYVAPHIETAHIYRDRTGSDSQAIHADWDIVQVDVTNGRKCEVTPQLHEQGFELCHHPIVENIDFWDSQNVVESYYPQCESLVQRILGSQEGLVVKAFDHNVRVAETDTSPNKKELKNSHGAEVQSPISLVHGDYTEVSAPRRIRDLAQPPKMNDVFNGRLPEGEVALLDANVVEQAAKGKRRYAFINVWRNIDSESPVESYPLACVDAQSVAKDDFRVLQVHYTDRIGENYLPIFQPRHRWVYFPFMSFEEAMLIKQWDSSGGIARGEDRDGASCATLCIHSAFHWNEVETPQPRKSIEVRCVCIW